jgi:hypothetical protein
VTREFSSWQIRPTVLADYWQQFWQISDNSSDWSVSSRLSFLQRGNQGTECEVSMPAASVQPQRDSPGFVDDRQSGITWSSRRIYWGRLSNWYHLFTVVWFSHQFLSAVAVGHLFVGIFWSGPGVHIVPRYGHDSWKWERTGRVRWTDRNWFRLDELVGLRITNVARSEACDILGFSLSCIQYSCLFSTSKFESDVNDCA